MKQRTAWTVAVGAAIAAGLAVSLTTELVQKSADGFADGFEGASGAPVPGPCESPPPALPWPDPCSAENPLVRPGHLQMVIRPWGEAFSSPHPQGADATWPNGVGLPSPLPRTNTGQYLVIPFTAEKSPGVLGLTVDMTFDTAQSQPGYTQPRPAVSMWVAISDRPGDFRTTRPPACWRSEGAASMFWTTRNEGGSNVCRLVPGGAYYYTISNVDPSDGLLPGESTCTEAPNSANGCDVQMRHTGQ